MLRPSPWRCLDAVTGRRRDQGGAVAASLPRVYPGALRPDGHVAWVGEDQQDLRVLLPKWFGAAVS